MERKATITLPGGYPATVAWNESEEGEIRFVDRIFLSYIHEHTRRAAASKAESLAPHVANWLFTI